MAVTVERGVDTSRIDTHDFHTGSLVCGLQTLGIAFFAPLGGAVHGFVGIASRRRGRHDVGDFEILLIIRFQCFHAPQHHAFQPLQTLVHIGRLVCGRDFERRLPGIVDQQIDMTDFRDCGNRVLHERFVGNIAHKSSVFVGSKSLRQLRLACAIEINTGNEPSLGDQLSSQLISQSKRGTGDDGDFLSVCGTHMMNSFIQKWTQPLLHHHTHSTPHEVKRLT